MNYMVRVKGGDAGNWNYTTTGMMHPMHEINNRNMDSLRNYMVQTKPQADQAYLLICRQASSRGFTAVALVDVYVFKDRVSERSVLQYTEF